jgi:predicted small secreted protein
MKKIILLLCFLGAVMIAGCATESGGYGGDSGSSGHYGHH